MNLMKRVQYVRGVVVPVVKDSPQILSATGTYAFAGVASDNVSKGMVAGGSIAGVVALVATSPVIVKVAVCAAAGCFIGGFMRGLRISIEEARRENV